MSEWVIRPLHAIADIVTGSTPAAAHTDSWGDEIDFITPSDQVDNQREAVPTRRLSAAGARRLASRIVPAGSTSLTCIGATIGKVSMSRSQSVTNQQINSIVARTNVSDPAFIYYMVRNWSTSLKDHASGSATPIVNKSILSRFEFPLPSLRMQQGIGEVLGALDDKIAVNTKLATTADEWVRASLTELNARAEESISVSGLVASRKELADPSTLDPASKYIGLEHLPRRSMWVQSVGRAESVTSTKAKFEGGDILFGKLRPYFHKVIVTPFGGVCSTDVLVLRPLSRELAGFALASVASDLVVERATAVSEGTRMPRTSWKDLASIEVPWPGITAATEYSAKALALKASVESMLGENEILATTRDALLPQLMSGKLRVKDAEAMVAAAV